jgi:hypothetical protein
MIAVHKLWSRERTRAHAEKLEIGALRKETLLASPCNFCIATARLGEWANVAIQITVRLDDATERELRVIVQRYEKGIAPAKVRTSDMVRHLIHEEFVRHSEPRPTINRKAPADAT